MTTDLLLIILGPMIPLLTYVFVTNLVVWQLDIAADRESALADRDDLWRLDWAFWSAMVSDTHPNTRQLALQMQGFLTTTRPETA
jgi:hypothetical protein